MKHLIPMTDFVLNQAGWYESKIRISEHEFAQRVLKYANFLKQPLELWMFVPLDKDNNLLEQPKELYYINRDGCFDKYSFKDAELLYNKAKERVLFENWDYNGQMKAVYQDTFYLLLNPCQFIIEENLGIGCEYLSDNKIENLLEMKDYINFELTQTAIDQIFN